MTAPNTRRPNADGTIPVGPLEILSPARRREALAAGRLHDHHSRAPELALAGHHERYGRLTAARGPSTHTAGRAPVSHAGAPAPSLEMRGAMVRERGPLGSTVHWEPRFVETSGGSHGLPSVPHRSRLTVEQRIQNALTEARSHLASARLDARLGASERANNELTAAEAELTRARRLARGARSLSAETRSDLEAVSREASSTLGTIVAAGL